MNNRIILSLGIVVLLAALLFWRHSRINTTEPPVLIERTLKCSRAECGNDFQKKMPAQFLNFPIECPKCGQKTAYLIVTCTVCQTRSINTYPPDDAPRCPKCNAILPPE